MQAIESLYFYLRNTKKLILEVTLLKVKNVPKIRNEVSTPFVQLKMGKYLFSTPIENKTDASCIEVFQFPVENKKTSKSEPNEHSDMKAKKLNLGNGNDILSVEVCNQRLTRRAPCIGRVDIEVSNLALGKANCQWYRLSN